MFEKKWRVVAKVKRYPNAPSDSVTSLSHDLLWEHFELGETIGEVSRHWTRRGAERHALHLNAPLPPMRPVDLVALKTRGHAAERIPA